MAECDEQARGQGSLASLPDWRDEVSVVPHSGIQFLDFGFRLDALDRRSQRFIERVVAEREDEVERMLIPLTGDDDVDAELEAGAHPEDDEYSIRPIAALEPFLSKWVPVPVLRLKNDRGPGGEERYDAGPSNWARIRTAELDSPDPLTGHTHRVQLALDTALMEAAPGQGYVAPQPADAEKSREFRLVSDPAQMSWFLRRVETDGDGRSFDPQQWVSGWLDEVFVAHKRAERPGRRFSREMLPHQFEHWSRYLAYLRLIDRAVRIPRLRLVNTMGRHDRVAPVEVDLVLDIGNSRTCGILIERFPGDSQLDLARSYPLEIRDLSRPEFHHVGLIASRVEFAEHRMGDTRHARRSGRSNAFLWPSFVRVGPEAMRLVSGEQGTETASGLSSPKRYLWDTAPRPQDWRFHHHSDPNNLPAAARAAMVHLNEAGDVLEQLREDERQGLRPRNASAHGVAIRPRFSRSALFGFMLAEVIAHALVQVNAPAGRERRRDSDLPRRLSRIILTLPTATTAQEQAIIRSRAGGALSLVWALTGLTGSDGLLARKPELIVEWDEASCTQLVYLYSELTQKFDGHIERFMELKGRPRVQTPGQAPSTALRLASIDIGGGTTDLMVTTYWGEADRMLLPRQDFREGFRVAGDELLQRVIAGIILPQVQRAMEAAGARFAGEKLRELFSGDLGGRDQQLVQQRRQFALRVLMPIAVELLRLCETADEFARLSLSVAAVLGLEPVPGNTDDADPPDRPSPMTPPGTEPTVEAARHGIPGGLLRYLDSAAEELGARGFRLADLVLVWSREDVDAITRQVFQRLMGNLAEIVDHLGVDVVLLTGRPSRQPAVRAILEEMLVVPPHRLISMHRYKTGHWYPFRDPVTQRVGDPKSTVAVGGMLIALCESWMPNFKVATTAFRMRSTARFIGEMDSTGQIRDDRVLFSDLDLDTRRQGGEELASLKMYTPLHLGARQLPMERWTTTPLYRLDFATPAAQAGAPLTVTLSRTGDEDGDDEEAMRKPGAALRRETLREAFSVEEVFERDGTERKASEVSLRLQTLGFAEDYWIDTGLFRL